MTPLAPGQPGQPGPRPGGGPLAWIRAHPYAFDGALALAVVVAILVGGGGVAPPPPRPDGAPG
ncbi:hypothetical protein AB0A98_30575, partial [Streptomyces chrestomyceticus]